MIDRTHPVFGRLEPLPAAEHPELLAPSVAEAVQDPELQAYVAEIDPQYADTEQLCAHYDVPLDASINAVIVRGTRAGTEKFAVCMTPADRRVDVNGLVRKKLDARKASFAPMDVAVEATGMEYGGITPVGAPAEWPIWVDPLAVEHDWVCVGSGVRGSKLFLPGSSLLTLPNSEAVEGLTRPAS
ncbi:YbaK/EbsC family protein [Nigerium massiliense]|uniref:YbaK/EbsC family protein n=1 Tax=Nigerium massiliense TaxID=1522317 RepID=UPI00058F6837|nr:YbaK/EbsC family protein [Nigerium massiliense]